MANYIKINVNKVKNSPLASIAGAITAVYATKKFGKVSNMYLLAGAAVVGAVVGANLCFMVRSKMGQPTKSDIK